MSRVSALLAAAGLAALLSAGAAVTTVQAADTPGAIGWDSVRAGDGSGAIGWDSVEMSAPAAQQNAISWD
ncbi:hypothetical protein ACFQ6B_40060 [Streptomyces wedmorensis]|uniref:Uncharacterized protein n=1 Tax=Streptomyces wedmorensis TaxID=43759 RepID=A0ABW6J8A6_STRWE